MPLIFTGVFSIVYCFFAEQCVWGYAYYLHFKYFINCPVYRIEEIVAMLVCTLPTFITALIMINLQNKEVEVDIGDGCIIK